MTSGGDHGLFSEISQTLPQENAIALELDVMKKMKSATFFDYDPICSLPRTTLYTARNFATSIGKSSGAYSVRKAWTELKLNAVFSVGNQPTVYFTEVPHKNLL